MTRRSKKYNLTFKHQVLLDTLQKMIDAEVVPARSISERLEQLLALDIRLRAPALRKRKIHVPDFVRDRPADILSAVRPVGPWYKHFFEDGVPRTYTPDGRYCG